MKDGLDRTGRKKIKKNLLHWNVALDALPGSAMFVHIRFDNYHSNYIVLHTIV